MNCVISSFFVKLVLLFGADDIVEKAVDKASSIFEDAFGFMQTKFKEALVDAVVWLIKQMVDLLQNIAPYGDTLSPDGKSYLRSDGVISNFINELLIQPPDTYNATVWSNIQDISEKCILPIATTFIAVIAVYDLYQMVVVSNGMHDFDSSFFIRWVVKTHIALTLVANAFPITKWIFHIGTDMIFDNDLVKWITNLGSVDKIDDALNTLKDSLMKFDIPQLLGTGFFAIVTLAAVFLMLAVVIIGLIGRLLEMYMYAAIAPIPLATMLNNETKGVGDSWIRGSLGLSFQVFFILIALAIFGGMFTSSLSQITAGQEIVRHFIKLSAFSITLVITILRSGQISKGMFGAH